MTVALRKQDHSVYETSPALKEHGTRPWLRVNRPCLHRCEGIDLRHIQA